MSALTIYHGGPAEVREPRIIMGRFTKDFGPGFYCTDESLKCLRFVSAREV